MYLHPLLGDHNPLIDRIAHHFSTIGLAGTDLLAIDHLCYRVETLSRYSQLKAQLSATDILVDESEINGRPISIFRLSNPLTHGLYEITALELPAPLESKPYKEGFEHAEFLVPSLKEFKEDYFMVDFDQKDLGKEVNPCLALKIDDIGVKFHEKHILDVVRIQRETGKL
ncbi:MAG TPA: VOC family protein [Verrucomicrobiae bacterium]|nr:VOC family protein [Verrucomicrobiae bacterium]